MFKTLRQSEIINAYKKTGLKPMRGNLFPQYGFACGLGAYYVAFMGGRPVWEYDSREYNKIWREINEVILDTYAHSFANGFDGIPIDNVYYLKKNKLGHKDGVLAWQACIKSNLF